MQLHLPLIQGEFHNLTSLMDGSGNQAPKCGWGPNQILLIYSGKKKKLRCYPQQLESFCVFAIKSAYAIKFKRLCNKIRPHRFGGEGVLIGGQQQH